MFTKCSLQVKEVAVHLSFLGGLQSETSEGSSSWRTSSSSHFTNLFWFGTVGFQILKGNCPHSLITTHNGFVVWVLASEEYLLIGNQKWLFWNWGNESLVTVVVNWVGFVLNKSFLQYLKGFVQVICCNLTRNVPFLVCQGVSDMVKHISLSHWAWNFNLFHNGIIALWSEEEKWWMKNMVVMIIMSPFSLYKVFHISLYQCSGWSWILLLSEMFMLHLLWVFISHLLFCF